MYPLKSQFCTHLSDSIRIDMYSFVKALFIARPTDAKQSRQSPDIKVSVWKASEERERGLCTSISSQWCSSSYGDQFSVAHVWSRGAVVFSLVDRNTDQRTKHVWPSRPSIMHKQMFTHKSPTHWQNQDCMFRICPESLKLNALICRLPTSEGQSNGFIFFIFNEVCSVCNHVNKMWKNKY